MIQTTLLVSLLVMVLIIKICFCLNTFQTSFASYSVPNPLMTASINRRYSLATNTDIGNLLMSGSKSGTHPTIVAIPLYIRNQLSSKYPSFFEILSPNTLSQNEPKPKKVSDNFSDGTNSLKRPLIDYSKQNEFISNYSTQRYRTPSQKSMKYNLRDEQKVIRQQTQQPQQQKDDHKYDSEIKDSFEYSVPEKIQWSSPLINSQNRYQPKDTTFLRITPPQQRPAIEEERKQSSPEYDTVLNGYPLNKFNDLQNSDQKVDDMTNYGTVDVIKTESESMINRNNYNNYQNYSPFSGSSDDKLIPRNRVTDKSNQYNSQQTSSSTLDNSDDTKNYRYIDSGIRNDNYLTKNSNKYQKPDNNEYEILNKNIDFQYRSPASHIRSYERSTHSFPSTTPVSSYTPRSINLRQNYENSYVTSRPLTSTSLSPMPSEEDSSQSMSSDNYNSNFQPIVSSNSYASNFQSIAPNSGFDSQINPYSVSPSTHTSNVYNSESQSVSPNNNYFKTDSKSQLTSISNPNYSSDYSNSEEDCYDDNSNDYKNSHSSQTIKSQDIKTEIYTKNNERDYYEGEELDPSKLDLKIVHLPVSLLRRLIGNGDLGLPGYQ